MISETSIYHHIYILSILYILYICYYIYIIVNYGLVYEWQIYLFVIVFMGLYKHICPLGPLKITRCRFGPIHLVTGLRLRAVGKYGGHV